MPASAIGKPKKFEDDGERREVASRRGGNLQTFRIFSACVLAGAFLCVNLRAADEHEECQRQIKELRERLELMEASLKTLLDERAAAQTAPPATPAPTAADATAQFTRPAAQQPTHVLREVMPPELVPEIGKIGAEVGITLNGSSNPFRLNSGQDAAGFIDLPLVDKPNWIHGKISYEILVGMSTSRTTFKTTSNVAQVANLTVLTALNPNGGLQNITDAITGTGSAPFPVTASTQTSMKLLQVVPFAFKYTSNLFERWRLRPYGVIGWGTYVTIHAQNPALGNPPNYGVRTDANLPPAVIGLVNQIYGGQAPFGGPLVAGQISQAPELEQRGLPGGHGNIDFGLHAGGGIELRLNRSFSLGFDSRYNHIAGVPGALVTYGTRLGFHF